MALASALVEIGADSALPRDRIVNTLHFNLVGTFLSPSQTQWDSLANDLALVYDALVGASPREVSVKMYDLDDAQPRPVKAQKVLHSGSFPSTAGPREIACCLSFYSERNLPRNRGRIFLPWFLLGGSVGTRPTSQQMGFALSLYNGFKNLGGADCEWCVFSRADNQHKKVSNGYVDDEWDVIRSRGLKPTTRQTIVGEG